MGNLELEMNSRRSSDTALDSSSGRSQNKVEGNLTGHELNQQDVLYLPSLPAPSLTSLLADQEQQQPSKPSFFTHLSHRARSRFPVLCRRSDTVIQYLRGPRPREPLPDPVVPYIDSLGRKRGCLPETTLLRVSRRFTSPWLLAVLVAAYIISLAFIVRAQFYLTPSDSVVGCTSTYWLANDQCGLNGQSCDPAGVTTFDFKCPSQCTSVTLANPRTIGNDAMGKVPLIVGGGDANRTYRGDSFICAAAVQAGMFGDNRGGCASLTLASNFTDFVGFTAHGLTSIGFPTIFPLGFNFSPNTSLSHCSDIRDIALAFNVLVTALLFFILRPQPIFLFWSLVCIGYWHVSFFSQPRDESPPISDAFGTFLPALFVCYALWSVAFRFVLPTFSTAPIERGIWYLGGFWPGVLLNVITKKVPIDRLVSSDITGNKGAITAIIIIAIVLFIVIVNQVRVIRKTGWFFHYAKWYICGGLVLLVLSQLPGFTLRLHHYILAIVFLPCTAFPTRLSALYQGFFLGMFLNGVAAFDFDSILQTAAELQRDAPAGTVLPSFLTNATNWNASIPFLNQTISWENISSADSATWNGFALLVDDVERYAGTATNFSLAALNASLPHFFRLAFQNNGVSGDFTKAATLWPNGTWVNPLPGPS